MQTGFLKGRMDAYLVVALLVGKDAQPLANVPLVASASEAIALMVEYRAGHKGAGQAVPVHEAGAIGVQGKGSGCISMEFRVENGGGESRDLAVGQHRGYLSESSAPTASPEHVEGQGDIPQARIFEERRVVGDTGHVSEITTTFRRVACKR